MTGMCEVLTVLAAGTELCPECGAEVAMTAEVKSRDEFGMPYVAQFRRGKCVFCDHSVTRALLPNGLEGAHV
jgi:hypothetical protein